MNRRDFLRSTAAAGAAVVAVPLVAMAATESPEIFGTGMPTLMRDAQREYDDCMREAMRQAMLMREKVRWEIFHGVPSKLLP
jgi:hypothetical protein